MTNRGNFRESYDNIIDGNRYDCDRFCWGLADEAVREKRVDFLFALDCGGEVEPGVYMTWYSPTNASAE